MDNPIFTKLQDIIEFSPKSPQWFSMAEQAVNTIYLLGEQPDRLCTKIIKDLTTKVFDAPEKGIEIEKKQGEKEGENGGDVANENQETTGDGDASATAGNESQTLDDGETSQSQSQLAPANEEIVLLKAQASSFKIAQMVFVVGHVALKHIVYLELVEREFKRRKDEKAKGRSNLASLSAILLVGYWRNKRLTIGSEKAAAKATEKDQNDLDAVAGNAEDDIGDLISTMKENELLYGEKSLLAGYGDLIAHICASPRKYRVSWWPHCENR